MYNVLNVSGILKYRHADIQEPLDLKLNVVVVTLVRPLLLISWKKVSGKEVHMIYNGFIITNDSMLFNNVFS